MLHLTFIDGPVETAIVASSPCFRITGGTLHTDEGGTLAIFDDGHWKLGPVSFSGVRIQGICQLLSGITRDLQPVCEPLTTLAVDGRILLANALPFARYDPRRDMWDGLLRQSSWHTLRIVIPDFPGSRAGVSPEDAGRVMPA
jgi:hypothetical protein